MEAVSSQSWQEWVALAVVLLAAFSLLRRFFRGWLAEPLAKYLLKRGKITAAVRMKARSDENGCSGCSCPATSGEKV